MSATDRWEALALGTVGACVGVEVEVWDADGRQGVPDGRFEIDGRIGFVEVTTDANPNARGGRRAYDERATWHMDEVAGSYGVWIDPTVPVPQHDRFVPELIRAMEGLPGPRLIDVVDSLEDLSPELFGWAVALIENHRLDVHALQSGGPPGSVFTIAAMSRGGWGVSEPDAILEGVASSLALPWIQKRLRKLAGVGDAEQYLFVKVDNDVWGWAAWQQLVDPENELPTSPPEVPAHLDGLWFWSPLNRSCVRWLRSSGWAWQRVTLPPGVSWR